MNPAKTDSGLNYFAWPITVCKHHDESIVTHGNPLSISNSTQYYGCQQVVQDTPALNDSFYTKFMIYPGNYTLTIYGTEANNNGIFKIQIDETYVGTFDMYHSTTHYPFIQTFPVTIQDSTTHKLKFTCIGKNASSSSYHGVFYKFVIE
jgi:hypothetical protein